MAVEELRRHRVGKKDRGRVRDNQNKPTSRRHCAGRWIDNRNVDVIVDGGPRRSGMAIPP